MIIIAHICCLVITESVFLKKSKYIVLVHDQNTFLGRGLVIFIAICRYIGLRSYVYMKDWCGPAWNSSGEHILWQIDSEWSEQRLKNAGLQYSSEAKRVLSLYAREEENVLSKDEYAWLAERGYVKTCGDYDGYFKSSWQIVILSSKEIKEQLLAVGERIKEKYKAEFDALKAPYVKAVLETVPTHLRKMRAYELQFVFHCDGYFLLHCITTLLKNGRLKEPTGGQRKALTTLIVRS